MPTYFEKGKLIAENGEARIYKWKNTRYLEIGKGHTLWTYSKEIEAYKDQIGDKSRGDCLEIGLGLGISSEYILSSQNVKSLTTIEINKDVINLYELSKKFKNPKHKILHGSGRDYLISTDRKFDFIFIDFYYLIDEDSIDEIIDYIKLCERVLRKNSEIVVWIDPFSDHELIRKISCALNEAHKNIRK
jgi:spermidine synthase